MYPVWEVPYLTAGLVLGIMASFHILPSHLSTSAMWFNIYIETKAYRENRPELLEFIKKYSLLLLVFAYVLGSLSGIGIWFSATVANPRGISGLIHNYVWGWATEWVFFIIEVTGIFIYYYTLGKVDRRTHLKIGWIFAIGSWTTMVIIVGILSFMLSPGKWPETGNFFDGFFNQTYWSQLFMRTALMFAIAGAYAIAVATRLSNHEVRRFVTRSAGLWGIAGLVIGVFLFAFYSVTLPEHSRQLDQLIVSSGLKRTITITLIVIFLYFIYSIIKPLNIKTAQAVIVMLLLFAGIFSAERIREILRKPYVIPEYMYSNQIIGKGNAGKGVNAEIDRTKEKGILKTVPFVPEGLREINSANKIPAGRLIALISCSSCHTLNNGGVRPLPVMLGRLGIDSPDVLDGFLEGIGGYPYMPPFPGTDEERRALAEYLVTLINK